MLMLMFNWKTLTHLSKMASHHRFAKIFQWEFACAGQILGLGSKLEAGCGHRRHWFLKWLIHIWT